MAQHCREAAVPAGAAERVVFMSAWVAKAVVVGIVACALVLLARGLWAGVYFEPTGEALAEARRGTALTMVAYALLALLCAVHFVWHNERLASRMAMVDDPGRLDVVVGVLFTALLLEASRRHIGPALVLLALGFVAYSFAGPWLPGFIGHGGQRVTPVTFGPGPDGAVLLAGAHRLRDFIPACAWSCCQEFVLTFRH